jgi:hypothetical protein
MVKMSFHTWLYRELKSNGMIRHIPKNGIYMKRIINISSLNGKLSEDDIKEFHSEYNEYLKNQNKKTIRYRNFRGCFTRLNFIESKKTVHKK